MIVLRKSEQSQPDDNDDDNPRANLLSKDSQLACIVLEIKVS